MVATDEAAFAAATIQLLGDKQRAAAIGRSARVCVERHYAWESNLGALDDLIHPDTAKPTESKWAT